MAGKNKLTINFTGFREYMEKLERLGSDTKALTEKALKESFDTVTPGIEAAIKSHKFTGDTEASLVKNANVKWAGTQASVEVGFDIPHGGLPSVFLMYGTPRMKPDMNLYNSIYGSATKSKVRKAQQAVFEEEMRRVMN